MTTTTLEHLLKRDRAIVIGGLFAVILLSWVYVLTGAGMTMSAFEMTEMAGLFGDAQSMTMKTRSPADWTAGYAVLMVFMWGIMMMAMMLPSAAPTILLYAAIDRKQRLNGGPIVPTGLFASGYILAWGVFSIAAAGSQWSLQKSGLLSTGMANTSVLLGGALLVAAGIWQLTPLKHACLNHCRTPLEFLSRRWRSGRFGALSMGVEHGAFCLGCCWILMVLMFYGGVMNLYWMIGLAIFVLLEKVIPAGDRLGSVAGVGLMIWGGTLIWNAFATP